MKEMRRIMVLLEGLEAESAWCEWLLDWAVEMQSQLKWVQVIEPAKVGVPAWLSGETLRGHQQRKEQAQASLQHWSARAQAQGVPSEWACLEGKEFIEAIRAADAWQADLLVKTREDLGDAQSPYLSSKNLHLMRKCPTPLLLLAPGRPAMERVAVALKVEPYDAQEQAALEPLNTRLLNWAETLSAGSAPLEVAAAWQSLTEEFAQFRNAEWSVTQVAELVEQERQAILTALHDSLYDSLHALDPAPSLHPLKGDPSAVLVDWVAARQPDVLVMGSVARSGLAGLLIGNTAEEVIEQVRCSLLLLKPQGFVSPVLA
jgi:nucleotide-binding universal stress UspA family protein